ncbi:hypothetical protein [Xanthomonas euvesicatoria]|uniref:hypothetical protein n=2 Tax=Xanthomonas euvesicatoria TaxID=456327 RepID=UPI001E5D4A79|nr:hypothetical protein [Xanthomonas euvesicatoria]MCC8514228.1 hypothetical protein [Xanthomonas euvesicatoria pv. euvesicatoria]MCC8547974.1 hypothetical protein [Xanthomonas euvesicatoria pv. euvesicatoria]MCC8612053.1 hypothetical protein [Xanthomonas euvesicatoria pv. euvesicatoria]
MSTKMKEHSMLTGQTQPLSIAAKILKPTTIQAVRRSPSYHLQGWKILDRWAFNSPEKLRSLEAQGEVILLGRLLEQQTIEHQVLSRSIDQKQNGLTEHDILASDEINTEL